MLGIEIYKVDKSLARISEIEWKDLIYTRKGQRVQIRKGYYLWVVMMQLSSNIFCFLLFIFLDLIFLFF